MHTKGSVDYTQWALSGKPSDCGGTSLEKESQQQQHERLWLRLLPESKHSMDAELNETFLRKSLSTRRSEGGKLFTKGGEGGGCCDHQVA